MPLVLALLLSATPYAECTPNLLNQTWQAGGMIWKCNGSTWVSYTADAGGLPVLQGGPFSVSCTNCSGGGGSASVVTVDGGAIGIVSMPPVTVDGGSIAVTNFPAMWPNLQWVSVDGGVTAFVSNFPASQAVTGTFWQATQPVTTLPATPWACSASPLQNQTLQCQAAPGGSTALYLTDYAIWGSITDGGAGLTKAGAAIIWGTGTNCATLDGGIVPTLANGTAVPMVIALSVNGGTAAIANLTTPIVAPAATELCCRCSLPCTCQLNGYTK